MIAVAMARCTNGEHQLRTILVIPCFMFYLITVLSIFYVLSLDILFISHNWVLFYFGCNSCTI